MGAKEKVILRRAAQYDPTDVAKIIREGLEEFGVAGKIQGRITVKPNVVMAHHKVTPSAYTRSEFLDGLFSALEGVAQKDSTITVAEKCGAAIPTSRMFRRAGYYKLKKKHKIKLLLIEESRKKTVHLHKGKIHEKIRTAKAIVDRDLLIYAPKLKTNSLSHGLTAAIKLNIGILCDGERMWNHNYNLDEKIVDLLEVGYPDFIAMGTVSHRKSRRFFHPDAPGNGQGRNALPKSSQNHRTPFPQVKKCGMSLLPTVFDKVNTFGSLPSCVCGRHGKERSDLEDLAFPSRSSRESNEVGRRVCLSTREFNPPTLLLPEKYGPRRKTNGRSYAGAEKNGEGMALKIRRERRHFRVFHHPIYQH